eukprot:COSAG06_NODE_2524_length_6725_cov_3.984606_1_plen_122_part_00
MVQTLRRALGEQGLGAVNAYSVSRLRQYIESLRAQVAAHSTHAERLAQLREPTTPDVRMRTLPHHRSLVMGRDSFSLASISDFDAAPETVAMRSVTDSSVPAVPPVRSVPSIFGVSTDSSV